MARPTKLNRKTIDAICVLIRDGNYPKIAALASGVIEGTFYNWIRDAKKKDKRYQLQRELVKAMALAEAESESAMVSRVSVVSMASDDSKHGIAFLERRFAKRWKKQEQHELTGSEGKPLVDMAALAKKLKKMAGE